MEPIGSDRIHSCSQRIYPLWRISGWQNVLSGVALICRTSSGPTFDADHTAIDTAHPQVVDRNDQASVGRMTAICGTWVLLGRRTAPIRRILAIAGCSGEGQLTTPNRTVQKSKIFDEPILVRQQQAGEHLRPDLSWPRQALARRLGPIFASAAAADQRTSSFQSGTAFSCSFKYPHVPADPSRR